MGGFGVLTGRPLRAWPLVVLAAVIAVASTLQLASPTQADAMGSAANVLSVPARDVGATTTSVDASLAVGAIKGTVRDAEGTHHGLADVSVSVTILNNGTYQAGATTAADGSYTVPRLAARTDYQVCFFATGAKSGSAKGGSKDGLGYLDQCYDNQPNTRPTPVAVTAGVARTGVDASLAVAGAVSGTVRDSGETHHGLANVDVTVNSNSTQASGNATTDADGRYFVSALPAGTDYTVCFFAAGDFNMSAVSGGSSDATAYVNQCYVNQQARGAPTPVTVTPGTTRVGIDATLVAGGAISGTVSDTSGTRHSLENVQVHVTSESTWTSRIATTAADGTYAVSGLAAGTDYRVCFSTDGVSDSQCYRSATSHLLTPVTVSAGATTTGIDADLGDGPPQ